MSDPQNQDATDPPSGRESRYHLSGNFRTSISAFVCRIPKHWRECRLKTVADIRFSSVDKKSEEGEQPVLLCNYTDVYKNECIVDTMAFMPASATENEIARFTLRKGDVLVTKDSESWDDIAVPALVTKSMPGVLCGYHLAQIRPNEEKLLGRYLSRVCMADGIRQQFHVASNGITRFGLPNRALSNALVPLPPLDEQQAIADFLDQKTAQIDALIAKKERLIELLKKKRQATISRAVTKGLNPNALMKPSGIDWLGDVPRHWKVLRLRFATRFIEQGWSPQCESRPADEGEWGVLKVGCVNGEAFDPSENKALPPDLEPIPKYEVKLGDLLMSRANTRELLGSASVVGIVQPKLMLCDKLYRIRLNETVVLTEFASMFFESRVCRFQFEREADGASGSMKNIGQDTLRNLIVPFPQLDEQFQIVTYVAELNRRLKSLHGRVYEAIAKLKSLRSALIAAAVTGQIDVRNYKGAAPCQ